MVNPAPYGGEQLVGLFRDLSDRVGLPLMVQDASGNAPAEVLLQAVDAAASISCLKLESAGTPEKIGVVVEGFTAAGHAGQRRGAGDHRTRRAVTATCSRRSWTAARSARCRIRR